MRVLFGRAWRFGASGLLVTALHAVIAAGLIETVLPEPSLANGIAFLIATTASYLLNTHWSFARAPSKANLRRFLTVSFTGLLIAMAVSGIVAALGWPYWLGIACVVALVPPVTFLLHHNWTYR